MLQSTVSSASRPANAGDMVHVPGGTFWMGSDRHYPEEAPAHRVTVAGFWMDRHPVTNRQVPCSSSRATGHVTSPRSRPIQATIPGALPHMLFAGSLVFTRRLGASICATGRMVDLPQGRGLAPPLRAGSSITGLDDLPVVHVAYRRRDRLCALGRQGPAHARPNGSSPRAVALTAPSSRGATSSRRAAGTRPTPGRAGSRARTSHRTATSAHRQ